MSKPDSTEKLQSAATLHCHLLISVLPIVLPLVIASTIGYKVTESQTKNQIWEALENNTEVAEEAVDVFVKDSYGIIDLIAANPQITEAIAEAKETRITLMSVEQMSR